MDIDVFVSHHTNSSLHIVEGIVNKLESMGIRCWYAPRDTEGDYATSIATAINHCKVFLLVLNRSASESFHVLNELDMVCNRLIRSADVKILPFHVADDEIADAARYYIGRMHWIDAMTPPMYQRVEELVDHICKLLNRQMPNQTDTPKETAYKLVSKLPQARDVFFGRQDLLEQIHHVFSDGVRALYLEGIGGIGKSELAKQYAIRYHSDYDTVVFFTYEGSLRHAISDSGSITVEGLTKKKDEDEAAFFSKKLEILRRLGTERTLFILDNFDVDDDPDLAAFLSGNYRVILTTRNAHPGACTVRVEAMRDMNVLMGIFQRNYGMDVEESEKPDLEEIFRMVDCHTYTIELIAKQMEASFLSAGEMRELLKKGRMEENLTETVAGRRDRNTAFGHICSVFNTSGLDEDEKWIMRCLSLTGIEGIKAPLLRTWAGLRNFEAVNRLIRKSWVRKDPGQYLSLHPMVREVVHARLKPTEDNMITYLTEMRGFCCRAWFRPYPQNLEAADCIQAALEYFDGGSAENFELFEPCFGFLWQVGRFDASIHFGRNLFEACRAAFGEADLRTGFVARMYAGTYFNSGRRKESVQWYQKGLDCMLACGCGDNEELALSYEKVGRCCSWDFCRDFEKAEQYLLESLHIRQRLKKRIEAGETFRFLSSDKLFGLEPIIDRIGESYMELGRLYQAMERFEDALECTQKYLESQVGEESPGAKAYAAYDMGVSRYHLARKAAEVGNQEEAATQLEQSRELLEDALAINIKHRGALALDTIRNQEQLADVLAAQGKLGEASNAYMAAMNMAERLLGKDDPQVTAIRKKMHFHV